MSALPSRLFYSSFMLEIPAPSRAWTREFAFPIDYSPNKHWELTSSPSSMDSYSGDLAMHLSTLCEVAQLLVQEQRAYHQELVNSRQPDPRTYSVGNVVFARHAVCSNAAKGCVDKLQYTFTGPWRITAILKGALYELQHFSMLRWKDKKHASDLSTYPFELIPFKPSKGSDN
jgi:hypothetical protein